MTTITAPIDYRDQAQPTLLRQLGVDSAYVLLGFPLGTIAFVLIITGLSVGAGLLVTVIGLPILVATVFIARGLAELERVRIVPVLRMARTRVRYRRAPEGAGWWRRTFVPLADIQSWLDVLHAVVRFPVSIATFSIVLTWWLTAIGGLTYWIYDWALPHPEDNYELPELLGFADTASNRISFYLVVGVVFALTLPFVVRGSALLEAWLGRATADRRRAAAGPGGRPHRRPRHRPGPDRRRRVGRGHRPAAARAGHPRRPAAAAGPPRRRPRPGPAAVRP
jgi:hypothetical protein